MSLPIEAALLRDLMKQVGTGFPGAPFTPLRIGEVIGGRIAMSPTGDRMLMIAGVRIPAQLPADLVAGQAMRLQVTESSAERLVLQVVRDTAPAPDGAVHVRDQTQPAPGTVATPYAAIPMPGGASARVWLDPDVDAEAAAQAEKIRARSMVVRYDSPELGRVDVVLRLDQEKLEATVLAPAGESIARLRSAVPELRDALMAATEGPVSLSTGGRNDEAIDVRV